MPAYANEDGKVVCFFTPAAKFKERYATFGFNPSANLDDGNMWPTSWALTELTAAEEKKIAGLVKKAAAADRRSKGMTTATGTKTRSPAPHAADSHGLIRVQGARVNNLKDVTVELPKRRLTVFTGRPAGQELAGLRHASRPSRNG